eukprot:scaffold217059_cov33-Tisochrysis_lutea.AAC.4
MPLPPARVLPPLRRSALTAYAYTRQAQQKRSLSKEVAQEWREGKKREEGNALPLTEDDNVRRQLAKIKSDDRRNASSIDIGRSRAAGEWDTSIMTRG